MAWLVVGNGEESAEKALSETAVRGKADLAVLGRLGVTGSGG